MRSTTRSPAPPRVLFVANGLGRGGAERQLLYWLAAFRARAAEAHVVVTGPDLSLEEEVRRLGAPVHAVAAHPPARRVRELLGAARRVAPDICHSVSTVSNVTTAIVATVCRGRALGAVRNDWVHRSNVLGRSRAALELDATSAIVVNSRRAQRQVEEHQRRRRRPVHFLPNAVDVESLTHPNRRPPAADRLQVLSIGSLTPQKRHDRAIAAALALAERRPASTIDLRLVGGGPLEPELRRLADAATRANLRIDVAGPHDDVRADLGWADVLLLASDYEGTPNVVLEAMASGLPVVSSPVGDVPDLLSSGGSAIGLAESPTDRSLAETMNEVWDEPELWQAASATNELRARENNSLERVADELWALYDKI